MGQDTHSFHSVTATDSRMLAVVKRLHRQDLLFHRLTQMFSVLVLVALTGIIASLFVNAWPTFAKFGARFIWYEEWDIVNKNSVLQLPLLARWPALALPCWWRCLWLLALRYS